MEFVAGFLLWLAIGLLAGFAARVTYRAVDAAAPLSFIFGVLGAFIGGMLGMSAYLYHDPVPLRPGGILGAAIGALFFSYLYHFTARRAI